MIKGYNQGDNITVINTIYHKPKKNQNGKYGAGSIDIVYRDLDTGEKGVQHIEDPEYTYYMANEGVLVNYNRLYIEKKDVHPISCKFRELKQSIAENTNNLDFFWDNIRSGNARQNDKLFTIPSVFNADMDIEDYYRFKFDKLYENKDYVPDKLYFDIEVDGINQRGDFPEMGECPINAVTLISEKSKTVYTLLLENYENPLIDKFKKEKNLLSRLKDFVIDNVGGHDKAIKYGLNNFEFKIAFYDEEINLIKTVFNIINELKPDFAVAWNIAFDLPYIIERIKVLGYAPEDIICHPDFKVKEAWYYIDQRADKFEERGDYAKISSYTVYLDQLITFASVRKGQRKMSGFKLDFVGNTIAGVRKLDYSHITTKIAELPYKDYLTFVFYNVMDVVVQKCIEDTVNDLNFVFVKSLTTNTRYAKVHRQTVYLINRGITEFYKMGLIMGCNVNKGNEKVGFAGAFVADPNNLSDKPKIKVNGKAVNLCDNSDDFDYKALYPSIIDENNMAPNTMYGKICLPDQLDPKENRFNNEYYNRSVWMIEDLVCGDRLNFCNRYLALANYEEMYNDIIEYFTKIKNPGDCIMYRDNISGNRYMVESIVKEQPKEMCEIVDNSKPRLREMCITQRRMVSKQ